jgi:hypothetical protein
MSFVLVTAALCASTVACGGDKKPEAAPTTAAPVASPLTKEAWVSEVNKICERTQKAADAIGDPDDPKGIEEGNAKFTELLVTAQADIRKLTPPAADAATIETNLLADNDEQIRLLKEAQPKLADAARKNDAAASEGVLTAAFEAYMKVSGPHESWVTEYGLTSCA